MPFDSAGLPARIAGLAGYSGGHERDPSRFVPYFDHVARDVVLLKDGGCMAVLQVGPTPYHLSDNASRNGNARRHFALVQLLADPQTEVVEHLVCHDGVPPFPVANGGTPYARAIADRYRRRVLSGLRQLDWFLTIIVRPRPFSGSWLAGLRRRMSGADPVADPQTIRTLAAKVRTARSALRRQAPVRLGLREDNGFLYSEIGEALVLIRTTRHVRVPLCQPEGAFGSAIYTDRVVHGPLGFLIERAGGRTQASVGRMIGLAVYPKTVRVGMFDGLLSDQDGMLGARWVMTNAVRPLTRAQATDSLELTLARMEKSESRSLSDQDDLEDALDDISSGQEVRARHAWSLAVHADSMEALDEHASALTDQIAAAGCSPAPSGAAGEAMYWSQWPGNRDFCAQPATIGLRRLPDLSSLEGHPTGRLPGNPKPRWGVPLLRFATAGGTAYDHTLHDGRLGHTLFCGPSDGGKTVAMGMAITAATSLVGPAGTIFLLDKDRSNKLTIVNNGGAYVELNRGDDSGAAPLQRLRNNSRDRGVAIDLIRGMILSDGGSPPSQRAMDRIARGVAFVMRMPAHLRRLGAVHAWLPPEALDASDAAARLKPWCRGERLGWAFDGEHDLIDIDRRMAGVDVTKLLDDDTVLPVMAAYLLHLASNIMDGRRMIFVVEEGKFLLPKPEFAKRFEDIILTGRKKNVAFWFVTQQPEHLLGHNLGPALLGQMRTRFLFKNELANRTAYCGGGRWGDGLHATPQEYAQVREGMVAGTWSVLIQRPGRSVLCRFDLSAMPEDLAVLSGTPTSVDLWDEIAAAAGTDDPERIRPAFLARLDEVAA